MTKSYKNITFMDAQIIFRNFTGEERKFNPEGKRNFCLVIDDEVQAQQMFEEGWNVRILPPRTDDEVAKHYIPVAVSYRNNDSFPVCVYIVEGNQRTLLNEDTISRLDHADIASVDLTIRPRYWDDNGQAKIKAYLKTMYVTLNVDELDQRYASGDYGMTSEDAPF